MNDLPAIARASALSVEAKLTGHAKRSDGGLNLRFMIHPHGVPQALKDAPIGTRYIMAMVEIGDDETPVLREPTTPEPEKPSGRGDKLTTRIAILCGDPVFQQFLLESELMLDKSETSAARTVRLYCLVSSRKDIKAGTDAAVRWDDLHGKFLGWRMI